MHLVILDQVVLPVCLEMLVRLELLVHKDL